MANLKDLLKEQRTTGEPISKWQIFTSDMPFYITNADSDNYQSTLSAPVFVLLAVIILGWINAIGWGIYGIVEFVQKMI